MTDWREAGLKADARRIQRLWTAPFDNKAKAVVRRRVADALLAAGGTRCLDLGGGGGSAAVLKDAGLSVISVEDGSMRLEDQASRTISQERKRRAHQRICNDLGVESRWGKAHRFASEADCAFLDFCGPWCESTRLAVAACQHMKAVAITLTTGHDIYTQATTQRERQLAYISWLKDAYRPKTGRQIRGVGRMQRQVPNRILVEYRTDSGHPVWVFFLAEKAVAVRHLSHEERRSLDPNRYEQQYLRRRVSDKARWHSDPEWREQRKAYLRDWKRANRERVNGYQRAAYQRKKAA